MPEQEPHDPSNVSFGLDIGASPCAARDRPPGPGTRNIRPAETPPRPNTVLTNRTVANMRRLQPPHDALIFVIYP